MKALFILCGFVLLLTGTGFSTGCDEDDSVDMASLPKACQELVPLCDLCS